MLPGSALLLSSSFLLFSPVLSGCNKDVLFNLRVSSLTEPGLYKQCYAVNRQARDAELRRLRGELRQHESNTAESFWQRSVAATRDKVRLETELDQAQAKASRTWFAPHPGASRCGTGGLAHPARISYVRSRRLARKILRAKRRERTYEILAECSNPSVPHRDAPGCGANQVRLALACAWSSSVSSRTLSRLAATLLCQKLSMVLLSFCLISPFKRRSSASRACLLTA